MTPQLLSVPFRASILAENDAGAFLASGDAREVFPLASVTKLFTAYSALIAISRGVGKQVLKRHPRIGSGRTQSNEASGDRNQC